MNGLLNLLPLLIICSTSTPKKLPVFGQSPEPGDDSGQSPEPGNEPIPFGKPVRDAYFQFSPGTIYFNHGGFGATPKPIRKAMEVYTDRMEAQPTKWFAKGGYHAVLQDVRSKLADLVCANASDLVFLDNASGGMNAVLRSLSWLHGDIILMVGSVYAVFPNTASWLQKQFGIRVIRVPISYPVAGPGDYTEPVHRALKNLTAIERVRIRLALFDHISSYPSVVLPVTELASLIKSRTDDQALVFVDGAHALGQIHLNLSSLQTVGVDFYVMDGHKWLMSPHGSALLWASPRVQHLLEPDVISSENSPGSVFQRKFDYIGTRDYGPWCTMGDTLDFRARELGGEDRIVTYLHTLAVWGAKTLADRWHTESIAPANMTAGLITVSLPMPASWPQQAQSQCAAAIDEGLVQKHKMQVIPFTLSTPNQTHWARISAQVYLERADFEDLAFHVLDLAAQCPLGLYENLQI